MNSANGYDDQNPIGQSDLSPAIIPLADLELPSLAQSAKKNKVKGISGNSYLHFSTTDCHGHHCSTVGIPISRVKGMLCQWDSRNNNGLLAFMVSV